MKKWFACELHCHTLHSDGAFTVKGLIECAEKRLLSGICLTDHNTVSGWDELDGKSELAVLKGIEYTTFYGHLLSLSAKSVIDCFEITDIDTAVEEIRKSCGIVGIAHPFQLGTPICTGGHWDYEVKKWENISYIEIFSEGCPYLNTANAKARKLWHGLLDRGYKIAATMGRDWHSEKGNVNLAGCTYLCCDVEKITAEKMKSAISQGRTVVTAGPLLSFETDDGFSVGDEFVHARKKLNVVIDTERQKKVAGSQHFNFKQLRLVSNGGVTVMSVPATQRAFSFEFEKDHWYSLELWGDIDEKENTLIAFTSAIRVI